MMISSTATTAKPLANGAQRRRRLVGPAPEAEASRGGRGARRAPASAAGSAGAGRGAPAGAGAEAGAAAPAIRVWPATAPPARVAASPRDRITVMVFRPPG